MWHNQELQWIDYDKLCVCVCVCVCISCFRSVQPFATPWTIQPSRLLCPQDSPTILEWVAIEPGSPALQADSLPSESPINDDQQRTASQGMLVVKNPAANAGDPGSILGGEDPLEKEMATHSSIPACNIPWTEKPGRLKVQRVAESWTWLSMHTHMCMGTHFIHKTAANWKAGITI